MKIKGRKDAISVMMTDVFQLLPQATGIYCDLLKADFKDREPILQSLIDIEELADDKYRTTLRKVAGTFITPYDREDLYRLLDNLDDVIDQVLHAAILFEGFGIDDLPKDVIKNAEHLVAMSEATVQATDVLKKPKKFEKQMVTFYENEGKMDEHYRRLLIKVLQPGGDPIRAMQLKTLLDATERSASDLDQLMRALGAIAIKET